MDGDISWEASILQTFSYCCAWVGVAPEAVRQNLDIMGIPDLDLLEKKEGILEGEERTQILEMVYSAVIAAGQEPQVVINQWLTGKPKELEKPFLNLIYRLLEKGKTVIYLDTKMFSTTLPFELERNIQDYKAFHIDPRMVHLA